MIHHKVLGIADINQPIVAAPTLAMRTARAEVRLINFDLASEGMTAARLALRS